MNAKICDKCGETYLPREASPLKLQEIGVYEIDGESYTVVLKGTTFDLCPACTEKLWTWLNERGKEI